jgi:hypothetical protein
MSANERPRRLYRYVIDHDKGFAPNPFFNVCTLACCKPRIRQSAETGDCIVGYGPAKYGLDGQIIYWMIVDEILTFNEYWHDDRYHVKRPRMGGSLLKSFGDNIYHRMNESIPWIQERSFHSDPNSLLGKGNLERDTGRTDRVLIARDYAYWGAKGPKPPPEYEAFVKRGIGETYKVEDEGLKEAFISWLQNHSERGFLSEPADWFHDPKLRALLDAGSS